ncbi:MAG: S24 family peptidase [Bacteroidota bacterium]
MQPLTERQNQVYEFLRSYMRAQGRAPSIKEIGTHLGIRSTNGVHKMIVALEAKGYVTRTPNEARGLQLVGVDDPFGGGPEAVGVAFLKTTQGAGRRARPLRSDEAEYPLPRSRRQVVVEPDLLPEAVDLDDCLAVVAGDDGMNGDGLRKGDVVIVEEADWQHVPSGSLAAVLFHDTVVVRRFAFVNNRLHFRAADKTYADASVRADDPEFFVLGRALLMMRRLA